MAENKKTITNIYLKGIDTNVAVAIKKKQAEMNEKNGYTKEVTQVEAVEKIILKK